MSEAKRCKTNEDKHTDVIQDAPIFAFPDNITLIIFQYLDTDALVCASKACRKWFTLSKDRTLWRKIDLRNKNISLKNLWKLSRARCGNWLTEFHLRGNIGISKGMTDTVTPAFLKDLTNRSPNLTAISLEHFDLRGSMFNICKLPSQLTFLSLRHSMISMHYFDALKGHFAMNDLHHLDLHECSNVSNQAVEALSYLKNLRTLNLSRCFRISARAIPMICANMVHLVTLDLSGCPGINDVALFYFGRHLKHLKNLYLPFCHLVTNGGISSLVQGVPKLQYLNLFCCHEVSDDALQLITLHNPELKFLDVRGCKITDEAVDMLQKDMPECTVMYVRQGEHIAHNQQYHSCSA